MRQPLNPVGDRTIADVIAENKARDVAEQRRAAEDRARRAQQGGKQR